MLELLLTLLARSIAHDMAVWRAGIAGFCLHALQYIPQPTAPKLGRLRTTAPGCELPAAQHAIYCWAHKQQTRSGLTTHCLGVLIFNAATTSANISPHVLRFWDCKLHGTPAYSTEECFLLRLRRKCACGPLACRLRFALDKKALRARRKPVFPKKQWQLGRRLSHDEPSSKRHLSSILLLRCARGYCVSLACDR